MPRDRQVSQVSHSLPTEASLGKIIILLYFPIPCLLFEMSFDECVLDENLPCVLGLSAEHLRGKTGLLLLGISFSCVHMRIVFTIVR